MVMKQFGHPQLRLRYALLKSTSHESCFVDDVPNGLKCNCICPHCRKDLIAKNNPNNKRESHFAHTSGADCPGARMSSLHMLAQNILAETKQVMLPEYKGKYYHHDAELKTFDRITKEEICRHEDSTRRPDCIGYNESTGASIWIEIYCRHKIDETKKAEIRKQQQYCIEIDFSDLLNTDFSEEDVRNRLLDVSHREWICCPVWDKEEESKRTEVEAEMQAEEEYRKRVEEEYRKMAAEERRERIEEGRKRAEYRLRQQAEQRNGQKNNAVSQAYQFEQGPEFDTPKFTPAKKDRIIQAVRGGSVNPKSELYSEDLAKEFNYPYGNNK